jgi:hypothetical protein
LELVMESLRLALNAVEAAEADWLRHHLPPSWAERYGAWTQHERLVRGQGEAARAETQRLLAQTGQDGQWLLDQLAGVPALSELPAVNVLRRVWQQQFEVMAQQVQARAKVEAGGSALIQTPHDPQTGYGEHGGKHWQGYELHLTETAEPTQPRIITDVQTLPAGQANCKQVTPIQQALARRDVAPQEQLVDMGYITGDTLEKSARRGIQLLGPVQADTSPQARLPGGLTADQFTFDYEHRIAYCPGGQRSRAWSLSQTEYGAEVFDIRFAGKVCQGCELKYRCMPTKHTFTQGRALKIKPTHDLVKQRRQEQHTDTFKEKYRRRAGIEASLSELVRAHGARAARYRGQKKVHWQHLFIAVATNLKRAARWLAGFRPCSERKPGLRTLRVAT